MNGDLLRHRRVLVVGASAGIGRAFAVAAVRGGAKVVLTARRETALAAAVEEAGGGIAVAGDLTDDASRRGVIDTAVDALGQIDLVLSTVGVATLGYAKDADARAWEHTFRTNVIALNQVVREVLPHLAPGARWGSTSRTSWLSAITLVRNVCSHARASASLA